MLAFLLALPALAAAGPVVDAAYVDQAIKRGAIVWDVRDATAYAKGHIPGAVNVDDAGKVLRNPNTEDFLPTPRIEKVLGDAGIDPSKENVVYGGRGNAYAYFGLYTMQYFGAANAVVFHDGLEGWRAAGKPVATEPAKLSAVKLSLKPVGANSIDTKDVLARVRNPNVQIVDARTPNEFTGNDIRAIRGGHIPGAINIPYEQNWVDPDTGSKLAKKLVADNSGMSLKPVADLKKLYAHLDPEKETIIYCQSGVRASETSAVLATLGFRNVKVYDSSWLGYGNMMDAPAEDVQYFNVGVLNARLASMQSRIDELEGQLAQAQESATRRSASLR
jgi:thiosulfate/3-mercaptopyruvate sulfurtransferase